MPSITENLSKWMSFNWRQGGDEWSYWWGGPSAQWRATIYERIEPFLPVRLLVEIAPGYGRWTQFLRRHCDTLIGIDLSPVCVDACRARFRHDRRLHFYVNDGKSLVGVEDAAAGFVFSFDSLVHVEQDVMDAYISEVARVLTPDGVAFLHHSNMGEREGDHMEAEEPHWRSLTVSAKSVAAAAAATGLSCFRQELVRWGDNHPYLNDCFSWLTPEDSRHDRPRDVVRNEGFMAEAHAARAHALRRRRYRPLNVARGLARRARRRNRPTSDTIQAR
jgi:SAM-dependent methyltransferase